MTIQSTLRVGLCALVIGLPMLAFAGPAVDGDGDGIPDVIDNCSTGANAGAAGGDDDKDGYGNACDGDFNNDLTSDGVDFSVPHFLTDFASGAQSINSDGNPQGTDMNCDTVIDGVDFTVPYFLTQFAAGVPGPSGLACAGMGVPCL